jgi:hypothetical protein
LIWISVFLSNRRMFQPVYETTNKP